MLNETNDAIQLHPVQRGMLYYQPPLFFEPNVCKNVMSMYVDTVHLLLVYVKLLCNISYVYEKLGVSCWGVLGHTVPSGRISSPNDKSF